MAVTHVIRGVDHLTNTARQMQVYDALAWSLPAFAHIPLVHGPDGSKLSKRHGAQGVEEYRAMGYLPAALRNYLVRLGWSHGDDEIFSTEQAVAWFDVNDVGKSPARFDFQKLADLNGHYIRQASEAELLGRIKEMLPHLAGGQELAERFAAVGWDRLLAALPSVKERAKTLIELLDKASYLIATRPLPMEEKAAKVLDASGQSALKALLPRLEASADWSAGALEAAVRAEAEATGAKLGNLAQPLRAALTGKSVSPPVFDVMAVLGRDEALARIREAVH
jgi:glutamyl-tRNA synthetase